jgi:hypothetical protein
LGDGEPTSSPLPSASGLSLAGFFFPLLQPILGMGGKTKRQMTEAVWMNFDGQSR